MERAATERPWVRPGDGELRKISIMGKTANGRPVQAPDPTETAHRRNAWGKRTPAMTQKPFAPKAKSRPASKGRVHKGRTRS